MADRLLSVNDGVPAIGSYLRYVPLAGNAAPRPTARTSRTRHDVRHLGGAVSEMKTLFVDGAVRGL